LLFFIRQVTSAFCSCMTQTGILVLVRWQFWSCRRAEIFDRFWLLSSSIISSRQWRRQTGSCVKSFIVQTPLASNCCRLVGV